MSAKDHAVRVLMLLENQPYPRDVRVRNEASTLVGAGYRVSVICPAAPGQPWHEVIDGVRVYRFPAPPEGNGLLSYLWEYGYSALAMFGIALAVLFTRGFDVIHVHQPPDTSAIPAAFFKLIGKCYMLDHHDLSPELYVARFGGEGNPRVRRALAWMEQVALRLADHVIATNESYKAVEMARGHVPPDRITVVRNGPRLQPVTERASEPALPGSPTVIGYVGVMSTQDGVDYLLRALYHLRYDLDRADFTCTLVGSGSALPELQALADELNLDACIEFTGWVDDPAQVVRHIMSMDICVAPEPANQYNNRSTAIKVMEYMALGKPVVSFDLSEHRISAGPAALYARPNDELDMARQIAVLMDDPQRRAALGRLGMERIERELAWPHQADALLHAYEIVRGRGGGSPQSAVRDV